MMVWPIDQTYIDFHILNYTVVALSILPKTPHPLSKSPLITITITYQTSSHRSHTNHVRSTLHIYVHLLRGMRPQDSDEPVSRVAVCVGSLSCYGKMCAGDDTDTKLSGVL
jgi:hypothetical protein